MLMNDFFGVTVNAARGIAIQVESAVLQFVNNFTTAINPQITKSYANGDLENMYKLISRGAKFSFFSMGLNPTYPFDKLNSNPLNIGNNAKLAIVRA